MVYVYLYTNDIDLLRSTNDVCKESYTTIHHYMKRKFKQRWPPIPAKWSITPYLNRTH